MSPESVSIDAVTQLPVELFEACVQRRRSLDVSDGLVENTFCGSDSQNLSPLWVRVLGTSHVPHVRAATQ